MSVLLGDVRLKAQQNSKRKDKTQTKKVSASQIGTTRQ
jgi:hypothetical protein